MCAPCGLPCSLYCRRSSFKVHPIRRRARHLVPIVPPVAFIAMVCERECKSSVALLRVHPHIAHFLSKVPSTRKPGSFVAFSGLAFQYVSAFSPQRLLTNLGPDQKDSSSRVSKQYRPASRRFPSLYHHMMLFQAEVHLQMALYSGAL